MKNAEPVPTASGAVNNRTSTSFLYRWEQAIIAAWLPRIPAWVQTHHLTLLSVLWSLGVLACARLALADIRWLWAHALIILCQYLTDVFDGAVGRHLGTGLVRWGYYMDHLLDFLFLGALGLGYAWLAPARLRLLIMGITLVLAALMASTYLACMVLREFRLSYFRIGPTELRVLLIGLNLLLIARGGWPPEAELAAPMVLGLLLIGLSLVVCRTQQRLWELDMADARKDAPGP